MKMEFGSDFHLIENFKLPKANPLLNRAYLFGDGRQAINSIINYGLENQGWKRLWIPEYFCYSVIDSIKSTGIDIQYYPDFPQGDDKGIITNLKFEKGDVLLRMNYFGLRSFRDNSNIPIPIIEDHSHNLISDWATNSNADYCVASLRKTLPLTAGGILWSPTNKELPLKPQLDKSISFLSEKRLRGMELKRDYLNGNFTDKDGFRKLYIQTEEDLDNLPVSSISEIDRNLLSHFDVFSFYLQKKKNYSVLINNLSTNISFLSPENLNEISFSLPLKFKFKDQFLKVKRNLIENSVYPAHLWPLPEKIQNNYPFYLSIHCDGRYNENDMIDLAAIINKSYRI